MLRSIRTFTVLTLFTELASAQTVFDPPVPAPQYRAMPTSELIEVDGALDEFSWQQAPVLPDLVQKEPQQQSDPSYPTEVRVLYDETAIYVGFICYQPADTIRVQNLQRDFSFEQNDLVGIAIDGFMDRRSAVLFQATPYGNQRDLEVIDSMDPNLDWDARWYVETRIHDDRWVAEFAIPWQQLRYLDETDRLGIILARNARGLNEEMSLPAVPRAFSIHRMSYEAELAGLTAPSVGRNIQISPYALLERSQEAALDTDTNSSIGGEVKWAITPSTVLDLTVNTDFAQADADRQVINLDRFSVFFPERRQFFLENTNVFNASVTEWISPFYSRRIGLDENGETIPLDGGLRLTYRSSERQSGLLAMRQEGVGDMTETDFAVARYSQNLGSQSRLGGMLTYRWDGGVNNTNSTATVDGLWQPTQSFGIQGMVSVSDDDLSGDGIGSQLWGYYRSNRISISSLNYYSKDYNPGIGLELLDTNYMMNSLIANLDLRPGYLPAAIRSINPGASVFVFTSSDTGDLLFAYAAIRPLQLRWQSGARASFVIEPNRQVLSDSFSPAGIEIGPGEYDYVRYVIRANTDQSKTVSADVRIETGDYFDGELTNASLDLSFSPNPYLEVSAEAAFNRFEKLGLASESKSTQLYRLNARLAASPQLQFNAFYQRDNLRQHRDWNLRLSWEYQPLSYIYVVYNQRSNDVDTRQLTVKATYQFGI